MATQVYNGNPEDYKSLWEKGYNFNLNQYVKQAWDTFREYPWGFVGYTLIVFAASSIPYASIVVAGPLAAGFFIVAQKISRKASYEFSDFFSGFQHFAQLLVGNLLFVVLIMLGFLLLVFPGIYLVVAYSFWVPMVIFSQMNGWDALETSRKIITRDWWNFLLMGLAAVGFLLVGILALGVGIFAAYPIVYCMYYAAFEDIVERSKQFEDEIEEIGIQIDEVKDFDDV